MENTNSIKDIIANSLEQIRTILDADTIVGQQIRTDSGTVIIPISKVSMGFASGGLDLPCKSSGETKNFGGGGGTGVTVSPIGFLTVTPDGRVEMLPISVEKDTIEQIADILDHTPDIINRIKGIFTGEKAAAKKEAEEEKIAEELTEQVENLRQEKEEQPELSKKEWKKLQKRKAKEEK